MIAKDTANDARSSVRSTGISIARDISGRNRKSIRKLSVAGPQIFARRRFRAHFNRKCAATDQTTLTNSMEGNGNKKTSNLTPAESIAGMTRYASAAIPAGTSATPNRGALLTNNPNNSKKGAETHQQNDDRPETRPIELST